MRADKDVRPFFDLTPSDLARLMKRLPMARITDLGAFRDHSLFQETVNGVRESVPETLRQAEESLEDPDTAAAVIRFPSAPVYGPHQEALVHAVLAVSIGGALTETTVDPDNGTPFSLSRSTPENQEKLASAGLNAPDPGDVHGFHTDVRIDPVTEDVFLPHRIALHNIYIGFREPGDLIWVPYRRWSALDEFRERFGVGRPYFMDMTPDALEGDDLGAFEGRTALVPVFSATDASGKGPRICVNGKISGSPDGMDPELPRRLQISLSECADWIAIPQTTRQVVVLGNEYGFHGRDTFTGPTDGIRVLLRMMDARGVRVGTSTRKGEHALLG